MESPVSHALPAEVVAVLDDAVLVLAHMREAGVVPVVWEGVLDDLVAHLSAVREKHVWDGPCPGESPC